MSEGYSKHCGIVNHLGTDNLLCTVQIHCSHIYHGGRQFIVPCAICCSHIYHGADNLLCLVQFVARIYIMGADNLLRPVQFIARIYIMGRTIDCTLFNLLFAYISWGGQFIVSCLICCSHIYLGADNLLRPVEFIARIYIYHGEDNWLRPVQFAARVYIMGRTIYCALFNLLLSYISWGGQF